MGLIDKSIVIDEIKNIYLQEPTKVRIEKK